MNVNDLSLAHLSDDPLLVRVKELVRQDRATTVRLLVHLAELEERKLYCREACSSLFTYCVEVLHLSEPAAYRRVKAARLARRFPVVLDMLADGSIHLAALDVLATHLTDANHVAVLADARHKTKREVEETVARLRPLPDAPPRVRRLPAAPPGETVRAASPVPEAEITNPIFKRGAGHLPRVVPPSGWGSAGFSPAADLPGCNPCLAPRVEPGLWCAAVPGAVDFDSVRVDSAADRTIRVVNTSSRELIGEIGSLSPPFAVVAGGGPFRLEPDMERAVTVRFSPFATGNVAASLAVGGSSPDVVVTGRGWEESPPGPEPSGPLAVRILAGANGSIRILVGGRVFGETGRAELRIVDVRGRLVHAGIVTAADADGYVWGREGPEGRAVPAEVYYLRVRSGNETAARSFVLLR